MVSPYKRYLIPEYMLTGVMSSQSCPPGQPWRSMGDAWDSRELPWIAYLINLKATVNATLRTILQNKNPNERRKVKPGSDFSFSHIFSGLPSSMDVVGEAKQIIYVYNA